MKLWDHYHTPDTVAEAAELLEGYGGKARIVAGGTDLLLEIRQGHYPPFAALVDITHISELAQIAIDSGTATVGAGVTHSQIVRSDELAARATCLVESCGVVGGPQVRNVGTLGGNVAHALPAADGTTSLVVLDAEVEVLQSGQRTWLPLLDLFAGPGRSRLDPGRDILLKFRFRLSNPSAASAFKRIMRPQGVALPVLACAVWIGLEADLVTIQEARVCIGPVAPVPVRATAVEEVLRGRAFDDETLNRAIDSARATLHPRLSKYRATAQYRTEMIEVLLRRALPLAVRRAQTGEVIPEGVGL
jgi:carbon-monoxide dehydrogenase medium subunit